MTYRGMLLAGAALPAILVPVASLGLGCGDVWIDDSGKSFAPHELVEMARNTFLDWYVG